MACEPTGTWALKNNILHVPDATQSWLSWRVPVAAPLGRLPTSVPEMGGLG